MSRAWKSLWRDPRHAPLLMTAYFLLSLAAGPVVYINVNPAPLGLVSNHLGWLVTAFLAWRVSQGGRISRALLIIGTVFLCLSVAIAVVHRLTPAALGALLAAGVQLPVLLSPAIYWRTRPAGWTGRPTRPVRTRRRGPRWLVAALACVAALGLTGTAVAVAAVSGRNASYNARTVPLRVGQPAYATLTPGRYFGFIRCRPMGGCPSMSPRQLTVDGNVPIVVTSSSFTGQPDERGDPDQPSVPWLTFTVQVTERVRISLDKSPGQPVFVAPAEQKSRYLIHWIEVAVACGLLLLAALVALAWMLPWRPALPRSVRW